MSSRRADRLAGVLLGMAIGDSLGLPREAMAPERARRRFGEPPLRQALVFGRGMISDDTEHAALTAQALLAQPTDDGRFQRRLAWGLRGWFLAVPTGMGLATLKACLRLCLGWPAARAGVVSAGNGPAMRAPVIGACLSADRQALVRFMLASTQLTHRHPEADDGARLVALAAARAVGVEASSLDVQGCWAELRAAAETEVLGGRLDTLAPLLAERASVAQAAAALGQTHGVSGYIAITVPMALYCWLRHADDARAAIEAAVLLGGDADTVGAIVGGLAGGLHGAEALPADWLAGLWERPRDVAWLRRVAERLAVAFPEGQAGAASPGPEPLAWAWIPARNACFTAVVLAHGLRRLLP